MAFAFPTTREQGGFQERRSLLETVLTSKQLLFAMAFWAVASAMNALGSNFIQANFPDRLPVPDLLFQVLPYVPATQYLTDIANIVSIFLLIAYLSEKGTSRLRELPFAITAFSFAYMLRGFLIILTPLGGPLGNVVNYGITTIHQHGQFPSGHTLVVAMAYMLVNEEEAPALKKWMLAMVVVEVVSLLLSHGHYSIDIAGGLLLSYFCYHETIRYEERLIVKSD